MLLVTSHCLILSPEFLLLLLNCFILLLELFGDCIASFYCRKFFAALESLYFVAAISFIILLFALSATEIFSLSIFSSFPIVWFIALTLLLFKFSCHSFPHPYDTLLLSISSSLEFYKKYWERQFLQLKLPRKYRQREVREVAEIM